jgi:membrane-associated phospholipid phosphatase
MRDELLADRPTDDHDVATTSHVSVTTSSTHAAHVAPSVSAHTTLISHTPSSRTASESNVRSLARSATSHIASAARSVESTYQRVRVLPVRTLLLITLAAYIALTAAVVFGSPLDVIDRVAAASDLAKRFPHATPWVLNYVMLGQRGPSSHVAFVYLVYRALRQRSWRPLVLFITALTMLNLTVGSVKLATGRLGPALTTRPRAVFDGGDIFPSGHTSNAVVIFGVLAMVAVEHRRAIIALAVFVSTTVGLSTIFLDTHWVTDVLGGWLAGALVLIALPATYALLEQWTFRVTLAVTEWFRPTPAMWGNATWDTIPRQHLHDLTSEMLTEDAKYR